MHKYGENKTTRIMTATVPHVTASAGRTKYQADGFLFDWVYNHVTLYIILLFYMYPRKLYIKNINIIDEYLHKSFFAYF